MRFRSGSCIISGDGNWPRLSCDRCLSCLPLPLNWVAAHSFFPALMLPPLTEATCVSDNTFTLADELTTAIDERGVDSANPGARRAKRHLLEDDNGSRTPASLPMTGNISLHDRR